MTKAPLFINCKLTRDIVIIALLTGRCLMTRDVVDDHLLKINIVGSPLHMWSCHLPVISYLFVRMFSPLFKNCLHVVFMNAAYMPFCVHRTQQLTPQSLLFLTAVIKIYKLLQPNYDSTPFHTPFSLALMSSFI